MNLFDAFKLPQRCHIDQTITKKVIQANVKMTADDRRLLTDDVSRITDRLLIRPDTFNCPIFKNDEREYSEIHVLELSLRRPDHVEALENLFWRAIPYPLIIVSQTETAIRMAAALTRNNQNHADKNVIESTIATSWLTNPIASTDFAPNLDIANFNTANLYALFNDIYDAICLQNLRERYPNATLHRTSARALLEKHASLSQELAALEAELHRESQMARKLDLAERIQAVSRQLAAVVSDQ